MIIHVFLSHNEELRRGKRASVFPSILKRLVICYYLYAYVKSFEITEITEATFKGSGNIFSIKLVDAPHIFHHARNIVYSFQYSNCLSNDERACRRSLMISSSWCKQSSKSFLSSSMCSLSTQIDTFIASPCRPILSIVGNFG